MSATTTKLSTKEQILRSGLRFLRKTSYNSFSFGDIAAELGIKKSSIHYYFPTKEDLGVALVQYYHELIKKYISRVDEHLPATEKVQLFIEFFKIGLEKNYLCPAGVLSVEIFTLPQEMRREMNLLYEYYQNWLVGICKQGLVNGDFTFEGTAETMAFHISSAIEGAAAFARAYGNTELFNESLDLLIKQL